MCMRVSLIAAVGERSVIGTDGGLPWRLPADMKHFRRTTMGKPVVLGRTTYESIGKPLKGRTNIVVTRDPDYRAEGCVVVHDIESALRAAQTTGADEVMVAGGASLYRALLPRADRLYLTRVRADVKGDTFFPDIDFAQWTQIERTDRAATEKNPIDMSFITFDRKSSV